MAVRFDAAADRLLRTASLINYNAAYTWMFWAYISTDTNAAVNMAQLVDAAGGTGQDSVGTTSDGTTLVSVVGSDSYGTFNITSGTNLTAATWYHIAMVRVSTTSLLIYLNGTLNISDTSNISAGSGRSAPNRMEMGASTTSNDYPLNGRVAYVKSWSAALSAAEIQAEVYRIQPARIANLYNWTPCFPGAAERLADYSGNGYGWTAVGTLTDEDPPPASWGAPVPLTQYVVTGTEYSFSATLTAASSTAAADVLIARSLAAVLSGASATAVSDLMVARSLAATLSGASDTAVADLAVLRELAATLTAASAIAAVDLIVWRDLAAALTGASTSSLPALDVLNLIALAAALSAASDTAVADIVVARSLAATLSGAADTAVADLMVARSLAAVLSGASDTALADLVVARSLAATLSGVSDTAAADVLVARSLAAVLSGASDTAVADLAVLRELAAVLSSASGTDSADLVVLRELVAVLSGASVTSTAMLPIDRSLEATLMAASSTPNAALFVSASIAILSRGMFRGMFKVMR